MKNNLIYAAANGRYPVIHVFKVNINVGPLPPNLPPPNPAPQAERKFQNYIYPQKGERAVIPCDNTIRIFSKANKIKETSCQNGLVIWDGKEVPSGIYIIKEEDHVDRKIVIVK